MKTRSKVALFVAVAHVSVIPLTLKGGRRDGSIKKKDLKDPVKLGLIVLTLATSPGYNLLCAGAEAYDLSGDLWKEARYNIRKLFHK